MGPGPPSRAVQVKTQQGVPSQPSNLQCIDVTATSVILSWEKPLHSGENIISYEIYWNDTFTTDFESHRSVEADIDRYSLSGLYPNTLYHVWLAAKSKTGEGASTPPLPIRTEQYGKRHFAC